MAGQVWTTDNLGGFMSAKELSSVLRYSNQKMAKFRQLCDVQNAFGKNKGEVFHWNVYSDVATAGGSLTESDAMPETNFTITQGSCTVTEYGNSVPFTGKLDNLSEHPVREIIEKVLKHDCRNTLDLAAFAQFNLTPLRVVPTSGTSTDTVTLTTNGTPAAVNNVALGKDHVKATVDIMKERNIPGYMGDDYMAIARPTTWRKLKNDLEAIHQYTSEGFGMILNGEIGRYEGVRFIEQSNVASAAWTNGKSDQAFFMGQDTVVEAVSVPEELRGKIGVDSYGRNKGVAWYYIGGFAIVHTVATNARIIKWDSAAPAPAPGP